VTVQPTETERDAGATEGRPLPVCVGIVLCDRVIKDAVDGTYSFIRCVDTFNLSEVPRGDPGEVIDLDATSVVVMLKNAGAAGSFDILLRCEPPSGEAEPIGVVSADFTGAPESGTNVVAPMRFPWAGAGVYWLTVQIDGQVVGRNPFRVNLLPAPVSPGEAGTPVG
jgi:hypothetical protein